MHRRFVFALLTIGLLLATMQTVIQSQAQTDERCFQETPYCISGRIREFWEQNGGLPVFGFPTTPLREELIEGKTYQVQWFERERLELHPEHARPYDVLLGRLGVDKLERQGRDWQTFPRSSAQEGCLFFAQTGQNICGEFLAFWRASGLEFDGQPGASEAESLALFGLPVSAPQAEVIEGSEYTVQWFERARFEMHPEKSPPYHVLFGLLGNELRAMGANPARTGTPEPVATLSGTTTPTATATLDPSASPTRTITPTRTLTATPTRTATAEVPATATPTPTETATPLPTATPTRTAIPQPSPTLIAGTPLPSTLRVNKLASVSQVAAGGEFTYHLSVATSRAGTRTVTLQDALDSRLEVVGISPAGACTVADLSYPVVSCSLTLSEDAPALVTLDVRAKAGIASGTVINNQVLVSGDGESTFSEVVRVQIRN